jgi:uncharacterized membrane protein
MENSRSVKIEIKHELAVVLGLSFVVILFVYVWPESVVRIVLGLPYSFLLPGYTLMAALCPKDDDLGSTERTILSLGLSIAVLPLIGLLLNYTPLGIKLESTLISVTSFILLCSGVAYYRRSRLSAEDRFVICFEFEISQWQRVGRLDRFLSVTLVLSIVAAIGTFVYAFAKPKSGERFTEFYILDPEGLAENYPREGVVGQPMTVTVGITNHEGVPAEYWVGVVSGEYLVGQAGPIQLEPGAVDERPVVFVPAEAGDDAEISFLLYRDSEGPYRSLHLWLTVKERLSTQ